MDKDTDCLNFVKSELNERFNMTDLKPILHHLNMLVNRLKNYIALG